MRSKTKFAYIHCNSVSSIGFTKFFLTYCRLFSCCISAALLGSIEELPGKSCAEIKASEGKAMTYGIYWIYPDENLDQAIQATCEGNSLNLYQAYVAISQ